MEISNTKEKNRYLSQWFTIIHKDDKKELLFLFENNHYVQGWFENRGYKLFENTISKEDFGDFLYEIGEAYGYKDRDEFEIYFPDKYIENYNLWNMGKRDYWINKDYYKDHVKEEIEIIFNKIYEYENVGILKYNIYYPG